MLKWDLTQSSILSQGNNKEANRISHRRFWLLFFQAKDWFFFLTLIILHINTFHISCIAKFTLFLGVFFFCSGSLLVLFFFQQVNTTSLLTRQFRNKSQLLKLTSVTLSDNNENLTTDRKMWRVDHTADYIHLFTDTVWFSGYPQQESLLYFNSSTARHTAHTASC